MIRFSFALAFRSGNDLFGGISQNIIKIRKEFFQFFDRGDFLPAALPGVLEHKAALEKQRGAVYGSGYGAFIDSEKIFKHEV